MTGATLVFKSLQFTIGDFSLEVDAVIPAGRLTVILGPSGCGKTTLLDLAAGFLSPSSGRILEGEVDVTSLPPEGRRVGVVFQDHALFPHMSVRKNIMFGPLSRGVSKAEAAQRADELLNLVRLEGYAQRRPASLSGGEKQRVALARALAIDPDILLLDEPFSALDAALRREMRAEVKRIQQETGITAVLVTHDQEEALAIADNLAVMNRGKIAQIGSPGELWNSPEDLFTALFLGRSTRLGISAWENLQGGGLRVETAAGTLELKDTVPPPAGPLTMVIRPDGLVVDSEGPLAGRVSQVEYAGGFRRVALRPTDGLREDLIILEDRGSEIVQTGTILRLKPVTSIISLLPDDR